MPLFANGEIVGDFIFMCAILLLVGIVYVIANLPYWIGAMGGSLGLWSWMPSSAQYERVEAAMAFLESHAADLSTQGREELRQAGFAVHRSEEEKGFRAQWELDESANHCIKAALGCSPELIAEVYRLLGVTQPGR